MTESLTDNDALDEREFDDSDEAPAADLQYQWNQLDWSVLRQPVVIRSLIGVAIALAILMWPNRSDAILARLIGVGSVGLGLVAVYGALRRRPTSWADLAGGTIATAIGAFLVISPNRSASLLGQGLGVVAMATAVRMVVRALRRDGGPKAWPLAQAGVVAGVGALLILFPTTMLTAAAAFFGIMWVVLGVIAVLVSIDPSTPGVASYSDAGRMVAEWLESRHKEADDRRALYAKILYDGPTASRRIIRFFSLMGFAAVIASTGVVGDSTAVVIGAMLIAPLMTPLMGMAISLVMGWPNRLARSTQIAGGGILFAIAIGFLVGRIAPATIDTATNTQILARTSPTMLDLMIAVAAGAAGAYGLSRPDVSDSLPGVAISISLVPPLTVVGISYSQGDWLAGAGALLLFATNMLAILVMGGITFVVTGVTPLKRLAENQHRTRTAAAALIGLATIIVGALLLNGDQAARNVANQSGADTAVEEWLVDHPDHDVVQVSIEANEVTAVIIGPSEGAPTAEDLAPLLATEFDQEMTAQVRLVVEERNSATA
ncbi:MAG: DUF389 domain-containing protein, partial [Actinomycetota bacterium]